MSIKARWCESEWMAFVGRLDLTPFVGGVGYDINHWRHDRKYLESDPYWRLYWPLRGEFRLVYATMRHSVAPGRLHLIPPYQPFRFESVVPSEHCFLHFLSDKLALLPGLRMPRAVAPESPKSVQELFDGLLDLMGAEPGACSAIALRNRLSLALAPFLAEYGGEKPPPGEEDFWMEVLGEIDRKLEHSELRVEEFARHSGLSRAAFSLAFRRHFGLPPKQFLTSQRIGRSKQLLLRTALSIKEIARKCGFDNELFFYRIFKKYTGVAPGEYRSINRFG